MQRRQLLIGLLVIVPFAISACGQDAETKPPGSVKIACVGDSITYGMGIEDREANCYPQQLQNLLGDGFKVENFGISGTTLLKKGDHPYWTTKQYRNAIEWQPEIVVIKLGTNDTKPQNWEHKDQIATDLKAMIAAFRAQPNKPEVFVCLPVPAFPERWGIRDSVIKKELIPMIREGAKSAKCPVIDLYQALEGKKEFFPDKIHPNKDGATAIATAVATALKAEAKALKKAAKESEKKKAADRGGIPFAEEVPGKYGLVYSPYVANKADALVNVTDENGVKLPEGTEVSDPHSGKIFRVP